MNRTVCVSTILALAGTALAQPADPVEPAPADETVTAEPAKAEPEAPAPAPETPAAAPATTAAWANAADDEGGADSLQIHGWASQGAMLSTGNNYLANTKRGSFEFFEAGLNVTKELGSNLRAGVQIFAQDLGPIGNYSPILDWAYVDYQLRPWLGIRAGHFKMPLYLYSDQLDADMSRTSVLMPQSVYDQHFRDVLAAVSGVSIYGKVELGAAGSVDYDAYAGTLFIQPRGSDYDVENLVGTRVVWNTPVPCLRATGHVLYGNFHEKYPLDSATVDAVEMSGAAPADWDGSMTVDYNNWTMSGGGLECSTDKLTITAEASAWRSSLEFNPAIQSTVAFRELRAYAQAAYRITDRLSTSLYTSIYRDSTADNDPSDPGNHQYDTAVSVRYDATLNLLVKAEAHAIEGYGLTESSLNRGMERTSRWGMFLLKTTLNF
jgi:hypothetical protein